ncbi:hypothetical protein [Sphingobacterium thalpophilum]|uniref:hypothetical protein n=1 Tax=Sphingobacterium thalpophilum TaxID=259 RepID=UPI003C7752E0
MKNINIENFGKFLLAASAVLFMYPYFSWGNTFVFTSLAYICILSALLTQLWAQKTIVIDFAIFSILTFIVYSSLVGFNYTGTVLDSLVTASIIIPLFSRRYKIGGFFVFAKILSGICFISVCTYLLRWAGVLNLNGDLIAPDGRTYYQYFANVFQTHEVLTPLYLGTGFHRFYSVLNEPGFIGTISALILCAFDFSFKRYKFLYPLLAAAILSFSLAAYITLTLFFVLTRGGKQVAIYIFPIFVILSLIFGNILEERILSRINISEAGSIEDNRTNAVFDKLYDEFLSTSDVVFGKGKGAHSNIGVVGGVSSWTTIIYNNGIIGLFLYLSILFSIFYKERSFSKKSFVFLMAFLITIYHRPNVHIIYYLLIFYGGLIFFKNESKYSNHNNDNATSYL